MNDLEILQIAEQFLTNRNVNYVSPGEIGRREFNKVEAIFLNPIALDPNAVIDPPDIKVWVNTDTKEVKLIYLL